MANERDLPNPPHQSQVLTPTGHFTPPWATWIRQLFVRVGGNQALTNNEIGTALELAEGKIFIGDSSADPTARTVSGDITLSTTGVASIAAGVVDTAELAAGAVETDKINANAVTNAKLAQMAANTIKGNNTGSAANASDLTATQATAMLDAFTGDSGSGGVKGLVPAPASGDAAASKYLKADGTWTTVDASGGGGINYIENPDAEVDTTGWATYADAAGASPVDGTGGAANITFTRTTSDPLRETASFLITKDAANRQGEGVSYDFTIARADSTSGTGPKVQQITADYEIASGTYGYGTSSTDSDLTCYIYDVTNSQVIQPSGYKFDGGQFRATFQPNSNSTSYRLCFHIATTSASAWTLKLDSITVGPQVVPSGPASTEWQSYTPTFVGLGTVTGISIWWRREGPDLLLRGKFTIGTGTAVTASMSLPTGAALKTEDFTSTHEIVGSTSTSASGLYTLTILASNASATTVNFGLGNTGSASGTARLGNSFGAGEIDTFFARIPIQGWSSNTLVSDSADTRVVLASGRQSSSQSISAAIDSTGNAITYTADVDTRGGWSAGTYTVKVPGYYVAHGSTHIQLSAGEAAEFQVIIDSDNNKKYGMTRKTNDTGATYNMPLRAHWAGWLTVGQTIAFSIGQNSGGSRTLTGDSRFNQFYIQMLQGPSQIAASEVIAARYTSTSTSAIATADNTVVAYATKAFDTHGSYNTSTGVGTFPAAGVYRLTHSIITGSTTTSKSLVSRIRVNSTTVANAILTRESAASSQMGLKNEVLVQVSAGNTYDFVVFQTAAGDSYDGSAASNFITIERIGGVM